MPDVFGVLIFAITALIKGMVMKPDKALCCMFLLSFFGLDLQQNKIVVYSALGN